MHDDKDAADIHVLQGERPEVHRNRSIGRFRLDLKAGGGDRSKIVVRFDLTLDGTLKLTATQPATGLSRVLAVDNALSQFQADERDRAESRLDAMFGSSEEFADEGEFPTPSNQWGDRDSDRPSASTDADSQTAESRFPEAVSLLKKAETLKASVEGQDARDIESLCENLKNAMAADDRAAVTGLGEELEDILFYVR